jgi:alkaline phosphatase
MKKLLSFILILCLLLSATSCALFGGGDAVEGPEPEGGEGGDGGVDPIPALNGTPITAYSIVYDAEGLDYNKRAAEYIQSTLNGRFGVELAILDDSEPGSAHEIVVGETSRDISKELNEETSGFEFSMLTKDGSVALEGEYFVIAAAAYFFLDTYLIDADHDFITEPGATTHQPIVKETKNYVLLIGDGMGVYQTKIFDYLEDTSEYSDGESLFYGYMFPYQGKSRTQSLSGVTDSAAGGTALATGYKTYNEYVGLNKNGERIKSLTELAAELGKATAVMSTENKTGATPASFSAHAYDRNDSSGILETQAELVATHGTVIDCGYDYYTARYMKTIEKHITDTLDKVSKDDDGFFLMYEEAYIDKHCHNNELEKTYLAVLRFNQAIARFMEYAFYHPETMVIITADHETGDLHPEGDTLVYNLDDHSAKDVLVFAWGMDAEVFSGKTVENIEIAKYIASSMGVDNFGDQSNDWYDAIYGEKA